MWTGRDAIALNSVELFVQGMRPYEGGFEIDDVLRAKRRPVSFDFNCLDLIRQARLARLQKSHPPFPGFPNETAVRLVR
jgi:hypothetical protein